MIGIISGVDLDYLRALLVELKTAGVTVYQTPELTLHLSAQLPLQPVEPEESMADTNRRLREQEKRRALEELEVAFAHVPGGAPPEAREKVLQALGDSNDGEEN